jgi:RNA polymerase sigma-70 factor, ECF subfamily
VRQLSTSAPPDLLDGGRFLARFPPPRVVCTGVDAQIALPSSAFLRRLVRAAGVDACDADDVAQEALIRIWQSGGRLGPAYNIEAWMRRVARNAARNHLKHVRRKREAFLSDDIEDERADPERAADLVALVCHLVGKIDPTRRAVFVRHELLGETLGEIAAAQGISVETARTRLDKARQEILTAAKRWDLERERRQWPKLLALVPLWPSIAPRLGHRMKTAAVVGVAAIFPLLPPSGAPFPALPSGSGLTPAAVSTVSHAVPDQGAVLQADLHEGARPVASAPASVLWRTPGPGRREQALIRLAKAALDVGDQVAARRLLDDHAREFRFGELVAERETLQRRLR